MKNPRTIIWVARRTRRNNIDSWHSLWWGRWRKIKWERISRMEMEERIREKVISCVERDRESAKWAFWRVSARDRVAKEKHQEDNSEEISCKDIRSTWDRINVRKKQESRQCRAASTTVHLRRRKVKQVSTRFTTSTTTSLSSHYSRVHSVRIRNIHHTWNRAEWYQTLWEVRQSSLFAALWHFEILHVRSIYVLKWCAWFQAYADSKSVSFSVSFKTFNHTTKSFSFRQDVSTRLISTSNSLFFALTKSLGIYQRIFVHSVSFDIAVIHFCHINEFIQSNPFRNIKNKKHTIFPYSEFYRKCVP